MELFIYQNGGVKVDKKLIRIAKDKVERLSFNEVLEMYKGLIIKCIGKWKFK